MSIWADLAADIAESPLGELVTWQPASGAALLADVAVLIQEPREHVDINGRPLSTDRRIVRVPVAALTPEGGDMLQRADGSWLKILRGTPKLNRHRTMWRCEAEDPDC